MNLCFIFSDKFQVLRVFSRWREARRYVHTQEEFPSPQDRTLQQVQQQQQG